MKKALVVALVLMLCLSVVFVACDKKNDNTNNNAPASKLAQAKEVVERLNKDNIPAETIADFDLSKTVPVDGIYVFPITWSVSDNRISVVSKNATHVTIDIPEENLEAFEYQLTATITADDGSTEQVVFNRTVPYIHVSSYAEYVAAEKGSSIVVEGIVSATIRNGDGASSNGLYLNMYNANGELEGGAYVYQSPATFPAGIAVGKKVKVIGEKDFYNVHEIKKATVEIIDNNVAEIEVLDYTDFYKNAANLKDANLVGKEAIVVTIKGVTLVAQSEADKSGGYYRFELAGKKSYVRISSSVCPLTAADQATFKSTFEANIGNKADVTGVVCVYSGEFYLTPVSVNAYSNITVVNYTDAERVANALAELTLAEEYKAGFTLPTSSWATVTWEVKDANPAITIEEGKAVLHQTDAEQTVVLVATATVGEVTDSKEITVKVSAKAQSFISEALAAGAALADKATTAEEYIIIGTVSSIKDAYSEQYKNISFFVTDGADEILVYRYNLDDAATIAVGQFIAIKAPVKKYGSDIEIVAPMTKLDKVVSIADAAAAGTAGTGVDGTQVYGLVASIDSAYNSQYKNITVTITDGTNSIQCYRMAGGEDLEVGNYILVTGKPDAYKGNVQIAAGATYTKSAVYVAPEKTDAEKVADAKEALALSANVTDNFSLPLVSGDVTIAWTSNNAAIAIEGANATVTRGAADVEVILTATLTLNQVEDTKDITVVVKAEGAVVQNVTVKKTIAELATQYSWNSNTAKQGGKLDEIVTLSSDGGNNSGKVYTDHMRIYVTDTPAGSITISVAEGYELVSIKITCLTGTYAELQLDGVDISNKETAVTGQSVTLTSLKVGTDGKQVRISAIEVVYHKI